jgi:hypothetical protein
LRDGLSATQPQKDEKTQKGGQKQNKVRNHQRR